MTVPTGPYVNSITFTDYLPGTLADGESVKEGAKAYETHATTMDDAYTETNSTWGGLSAEGVLTIPEPDMQTMLLALRDNVEPIGAAVYDGLIALKDAMDAHGDNLTTFKTTHSNLKSRVETFNSLPANEYSYLQKQEGLPMQTTRTSTGRADLVADLLAAQETYDGYIDTCVAAIEAAVPTIVHDGPKNLVANITLIKKSYGLATTWADRGASFRGAGKGRMRFIWKADQKTLSNFVHEGVPGWKDVHKDGTMLNKFLPKWMKDRIPDVDSFTDMKMAKSMDAWYSARIDNVNFAVHHYKVGLLMAMPTWALNGLEKIKDSKAGRFIQVSQIKKHNGKWRVEFNVGGKSSYQIPEKIRSKMGKFDDAKKFFEKVGDNKIVKNGGRLLGVLDMGATYYESYGKNYNEALLNNPNASEAELREEAVKSAAIEGSAENAGKVVGGVVGRAAGAAIGQAIIPIPGVGAAVGGFVGGVVGDYVGGKVGAAAGEFINDWRQGGASKAFGDFGKAASDIGSSVVDGAKDIGKSIGKKLFGW